MRKLKLMQIILIVTTALACTNNLNSLPENVYATDNESYESISQDTCNKNLNEGVKTEGVTQELMETNKEIESNENVVDDGFVYNENIPMPKAHQQYLFSLCSERNLDYKKVLAIIKNESQFKSNCITNRDYGYFQVNECNHSELSKKLGTVNDALDPYININWGTHMLSDIYMKWEKQGYYGSALDNIVLSEYNQGATGLKKWGLATEYLKRVKKELDYVNSVF